MGWQTSETGMEQSKVRLRTFLQRNGVVARKCLWHAASIFAMLRNVRHFACYDAQTLCFAVNYIWAYERLLSPTENMT